MPISPRYRERKHKGNEEAFDNKTIINYLNFKLPKTNNKYTAKDLSELFNIKLMTIYNWSYRYGWKKFLKNIQGQKKCQK